MKWPSRSASAARNSANISSSVTRFSLGFAARNRLPAPPPQPPLEGAECPAYKAANFGPAAAGGPFLATESIGVTMKLMGWAIALAAIGLTPAAAVAQDSAAAPATTAAPAPATPAPAGVPADA